MMTGAPSEPSATIPEEIQRRSRLVLQALPVLFIPVFLSVAVTVFLVRITTQTSLAGLREAESGHPLAVIGIIVMVVFFTALIVLLRLGRPTVSALMLIGVWTLITTSVTLRGGVGSLGPAFLIVPICAAGLLIDGAASMSLAALATVLVGGLGWLEMQGIYVVPDRLLPLSIQPYPLVALPLFMAGVWAGLFWTVALLTSLLAGGLQRALQQSRSQAQALRELSDQLEARVATQTSLLLNKARETAILEERTRLARDIHDTLAQGLTGVVVQLGAAKRALEVAPDESMEHLDLAQLMARESLAEARRSVWNLRSPALEHGDLSDTLKALALRPLGTGVTVNFEQKGAVWALPTAVESTLLRVCQEALSNVARHAQATAVNIVLEYGADCVRLSIRDNGLGFDEQVLGQATSEPGLWGKFGLVGMRERVGALGGTLQISNENGAHILAVIPRSSDGRSAANAGEVTP